MGYDCTLHLIDPASIGRFIDWFLERPVDAKAFEEVFDTRGLRREIVARIEHDARAGARAVLEGLLTFCSTEAPHVQARGFCLGLWHKLELGIADELPIELQMVDALTPLLRPILERYPAMGSRLFTGIDQNHAVGHYVAPDRVAALRQHVERSLVRVRSSDQDVVEALLRVLRAAESRGLAYWEATDLAVANGNPDWLAPKRARTSRRHRPSGKQSIKLAGARIANLIFEHDGIVALTSTADERSWFVDGRTEPPVVHDLPGIHFSSLVRTADGRTLGFARRAGINGSRICEVELAGPGVRELELITNWMDAVGLVRIGARVLALPGSPDYYQRQARPMWLDQLEPIALDEKPDRSAYHAVDFGDGSALVLVGKKVFRIVDRQVDELPAPALVGYNLQDAPQGVPLGNGELLLALADAPTPRDGVIRLEEAPKPRLVTISTAGAVTDVLPELAAASRAWPGPDGAAIVLQEDPLERDLLKVYWHRSREVTSIPHALAGETKGHCQNALYVTSLGELWISFDRKVVRIPWSEISALPRQSAVAFAAAHNAIIEERRREDRERTWRAIRARAFATPFDEATITIREGDVIEHPTLGRGLVLTTDSRSPEYEAELEDGSIHSFPRGRG